MLLCLLSFVFFFNATAPTEIYTLSLHDALPIWILERRPDGDRGGHLRDRAQHPDVRQARRNRPRSEEHTSELQSQSNLVCRLLLEKKKKQLKTKVQKNNKHTDTNIHHSRQHIST